ncbi:hypothetical protein F8388_003293 [Cannabis sativa]|uniref:Uncharacterized protein n=1 Tax=Cannabis sativa TaxID=3483 RepID=A0A7J6DWI4_CANSA|nr:hypothetical protein F8388_014949 [Cannabis sativa]KAF4351640.1 hypothetical protein F8388_003293 [Cannabis sativa]
MGCFLACFGFSHKRKIRKPAHKRYGSYKPLDSSSITIVRLSSSHKNPITVGDFEPRHKTKEQQQEQKPSSKIRKKVRFNLNVQTYEPVSTSYDNFLEKEEEIHDEKMEIFTTTSLHSVLKPVENINQWREAKAKTAPLKQQRKENIQLFRQSSSSCLSQQQQKQPFDYQSKPLLQEIAVDSSLSSWLTSKTIQSV